MSSAKQVIDNIELYIEYHLIQNGGEEYDRTKWVAEVDSSPPGALTIHAWEFTAPEPTLADLRTYTRNDVRNAIVTARSTEDRKANVRANFSRPQQSIYGLFQLMYSKLDAQGLTGFTPADFIADGDTVYEGMLTNNS